MTWIISRALGVSLLVSGRVEGTYLNRRLERGNMHAVEYLVG